MPLPPLWWGDESHHVADCEARRVIVVNIFAAVTVRHLGQGSASPRSPWRAKNGAIAAVVCDPGWRSHGRRRRDRRGGLGQNRILGSGHCLPTPHTATPVGLSVATWTSRDGTEPPRFYVSRKPWGDQRRPEPGQALDRVSWPFWDRTVNEMETRARCACLPSRPGDLFCRVCGGLLLHGDGHDRSLFHQSRANGGDGDIIGPQRVDNPAEHPDAIHCFGWPGTLSLLPPPWQQPGYKR
ncbi:hypothetical protein HPB47_022868 [Ixodes persulcatus]|uniref:Uncharacterized protein n=1 Tax=Ixodes persulcatus TaxID=34615 RepID=A0AC60Q8W4_IXOPE|nr:hypothetical protein HPB47_022868 [Ixodes persulcatus]